MSKRHSPERDKAEAPLLHFLPWIVLALGCAYLFINALMMPQDGRSGLRVQQFGRVPLVESGRVKPMDTFARTSLMLISRRTYFVDNNDQTQPAILWLVNVLANKGDDYKVFYIENGEVRDLLGLERRKGFRYAISEFSGKAGLLQKQVDRLEDIEPGNWSTFEVKLMELVRRVRLYSQVRDLFNLGPLDPNNEKRPDERTLRNYFAYIEGTKNKTPHVVPMADGTWQTFPHGFIIDAFRKEESRPVAYLQAMDRALQEPVNEARFNEQLNAYQEWLRQNHSSEVAQADLEVLFNNFDPFSRCFLLYVIVGLLAVSAWLALPLLGRPWMDALNRSAFWLGLLTLAVHSFGIIIRMYIQGVQADTIFRAPVTNLYSSAIFIGWCGVILGLVIERLFRIGIGNVIVGAVGYLTSITAYHLAENQMSTAYQLQGGDTMEMMQAVLDTNFWLWTHVTCVTFGYAATFVAGLVGVVFIVLGLFTRLLTREVMKALGQVIYGIVCFAVLLSFVGTVLGGFWADQSWGRFWGWDPKENGALLIVIWNALILHARWCGWAKVRGMALLAIAGNMVTLWSWFGTNQLGVGLHAYGFNKTLADALVWLWAAHLALIGIGLIPTSKWQSFGNDVPATAGKQPRKSKDEEDRSSDLDERAKDEPLRSAIKPATDS